MGVLTGFIDAHMQSGMARLQFGHVGVERAELLAKAAGKKAEIISKTKTRDISLRIMTPPGTDNLKFYT